MRAPAPAGRRRHPRPRLAVSSCLLGAPVRYDGGCGRDRFLADRLSRHVDWVPVCPETEIGLGVPRPALRLLTDGRLITEGGAADHTAAVTRLAEERIPLLEGLDGYVFKSRSPSCGLLSLPRYEPGRPGAGADGRPVDHRGRGLFAALIHDALPDLPVQKDGGLRDPLLREHFIERVFAQARLRELFTGGWRPRELVEFHGRHKMQLLAHAPAGYRETGRIVARAGARRPAELEADYRRAFTAALAVPADRGRHVNALQHVLGFASDRLDAVRRRDVLAAIEAYRCGRAPLGAPIALLRRHAEAEGLDYLSRQTYLDPFPADLFGHHP